MKMIRTLLSLALLALIIVPHIAAQPRSLDGQWEFTTDPAGRMTVETLGEVSTWRTIRVPYSWNAQFADLREYRGIAWYRRSVNLPAPGAQQTILLNFGAVDYAAAVYVNGQLAGENEGGYLPFQIDIGRQVRPGRNEIVVRVIDPDEDRQRWQEMNSRLIPQGRQSWYAQMGGIWQSVSWEVRPLSYLVAARVTASINGEVEVGIERRQSSRAGQGGSLSSAPVEVTIIDPQGRVAGRTTARLVAGGPGDLTARLKVSAPRLWSPETPALYRVEVRYGNDRLTDRFGFRRFEAREGMLYLNGEPVYLFGAVDRDFYPEGIHTPPSREYLVEQMKRVKQLGTNLIRVNVKVPTPDYLYAADEVGLLIWSELPSWDRFEWSPAAGRRAEATFLGQLNRDWNHPSMVIQSIVNEGWGLFNSVPPEPRLWLKSAYDRLAPVAARAGRLTIDNSPCCESYHLKTDIADFHEYQSIPDHRRLWDFWVAQFAARADWLWSWHGDAARSESLPLVVSEFGNWSLPELPESLPSWPWWLDRPTPWLPEVTNARGARERFQSSGLDRLFASFKDLARATQRHQWQALKYQIEEIRRHHSIQGYAIASLTDAAWEATGIFDSNRQPKVPAENLATLQKPDLVLARPASWNYTSGEIIELKTWVARHSPLATERLTVHYLVNGQELNRLEIPPQSRGAVYRDIWKNLKAPLVKAPTRMTVHLELRQAQRIVSRNEMTVFIYPQPQRRAGTIILGSRLYRMEAGLVAAGYTIVDQPKSDTVIITDQIDEMAWNHLQAGRRVLHIAAMPENLPGGRLRVVPRDDNAKFEGDWVTNFNWVDSRRGPFKGLTFETSPGQILGFESEAVSPMLVIDGLEPGNFDDVMAGIFLGWINGNGALMMGARIGPGRAILTTFNLAEPYATDPYARYLVDQAIELLRDGSFAPRLQLLPGGRAVSE